MAMVDVTVTDASVTQAICHHCVKSVPAVLPVPVTATSTSELPPPPTLASLPGYLEVPRDTTTP